VKMLEDVLELVGFRECLGLADDDASSVVSKRFWRQLTSSTQRINNNISFILTTYTSWYDTRKTISLLEARNTIIHPVNEDYEMTKIANTPPHAPRSKQHVGIWDIATQSAARERSL